MELPLIEQACGCFVLRDRGGLMVRAWFECWHYSGAECLPPRLTGACLGNGAATKLRLIEQDSVRLLHGARWRRTQGE